MGRLAVVVLGVIINEGRRGKVRLVSTLMIVGEFGEEGGGQVA